MNTTKVTSFGFAIWLVARGVAPLTVERVPGTNQRVYTFDADQVAENKPGFRRASHLLTIEDAVPTIPSSENHTNAIDQRPTR